MAVGGIGSLKSRLTRVPAYVVRSGTSFLAARRLARRWPELGEMLVAGRKETGGETERRDAVRDAVPNPEAQISLLVPSKRPRMIDNIVDNVSRQTLMPREVVLVVDETTHTADDIADLAGRLDPVLLVTVFAPPSASLGERLNAAIESSSSEWLARMDDDDWYGQDYLADSVRAAVISGAVIVGKATYPVVWQLDGRARIRFPGWDYRFVSAVAGATMFWNRHSRDVRFPDRSIGEDGGAQQRVLRRGGTIFSSDRFQFVVQRQEDATWADREGRLEASGPLMPTAQAYLDHS